VPRLGEALILLARTETGALLGLPSGLVGERVCESLKGVGSARGVGGARSIGLIWISVGTMVSGIASSSCNSGIRFFLIGLDCFGAISDAGNGVLSGIGFGFGSGADWTRVGSKATG
jgi:hypothetical protein